MKQPKISEAKCNENGWHDGETRQTSITDGIKCNLLKSILIWKITKHNSYRAATQNIK